MTKPGTTVMRGSICARMTIRVRGLPSAKVAWRLSDPCRQDIRASRGINRCGRRGSTAGQPPLHVYTAPDSHDNPLLCSLHIASLYTLCAWLVHLRLSPMILIRLCCIQTVTTVVLQSRPSQVHLSPGLLGSGCTSAQEPARSFVRRRWPALAGSALNPGAGKWSLWSLSRNSMRPSS